MPPGAPPRRLRGSQHIPGVIRVSVDDSGTGQLIVQDRRLAATNVASLSILPTFEAPPGEPRSSKNS
jgi:hypothetical protein